MNKESLKKKIIDIISSKLQIDYAVGEEYHVTFLGGEKEITKIVEDILNLVEKHLSIPDITGIKEYGMKLYIFLRMDGGLPIEIETFTSLDKAKEEYHEYTGHEYGTGEYDLKDSIICPSWAGSDIFTIDVSNILKDHVILTKEQYRYIIDYLRAYFRSEVLNDNRFTVITKEEIDSLREWLEDYNMIDVDMKGYIEGINILKSALRKLGLIAEEG